MIGGTTGSRGFPGSTTAAYRRSSTGGFPGWRPNKTPTRSCDASDESRDTVRRNELHPGLGLPFWLAGDKSTCTKDYTRGVGPLEVLPVLRPVPTRFPAWALHPLDPESRGAPVFLAWDSGRGASSLDALTGTPHDRRSPAEELTVSVETACPGEPANADSSGWWSGRMYLCHEVLVPEPTAAGIVLASHVQENQTRLMASLGRVAHGQKTTFTSNIS